MVVMDRIGPHTADLWRLCDSNPRQFGQQAASVTPVPDLTAGKRARYADFRFCRVQRSDFTRFGFSFGAKYWIATQVPTNSHAPGELIRLRTQT